MDKIRRKILKTGAAATAMAAVPRVLAQQAGQKGAAMSFYEKGLVRIHYEQVGSADSAGGAPDTFLPSRASFCFDLDGGVRTTGWQQAQFRKERRAMCAPRVFAARHSWA